MGEWWKFHCLSAHCTSRRSSSYVRMRTYSTIRCSTHPYFLVMYIYMYRYSESRTPHYNTRAKFSPLLLSHHVRPGSHILRAAILTIHLFIFHLFAPFALLSLMKDKSLVSFGRWSSWVEFTFYFILKPIPVISWPPAVEWYPMQTHLAAVESRMSEIQAFSLGLWKRSLDTCGEGQRWVLSRGVLLVS